MTESIALGTTKRVWHVVGPDNGKHKGVWYCQDTREDAEAAAKGIKGAQISEGTATYSSPGEGHYNYWAVYRPEYDTASVPHG